MRVGLSFRGKPTLFPGVSNRERRCEMAKWNDGDFGEEFEREGRKLIGFTMVAGLFMGLLSMALWLSLIGGGIYVAVWVLRLLGVLQ
jgi:hypothetical protein